MAISLYRPNDALAEKSTFDVMPLAFQLADKLATTDFVPVALRNKPAAIAACILYGHEVGLPPMAALQLVNVIEGKPGLSAAGQRALILAHGHRIWVEEQTVTRATVCSQRRGEERVSTTTWTIDDAERARLRHKDNWTKYPRNMLVARATGDNARGNFMDVLAGLAYNLEELQDLSESPIESEAGEVTTSAAPSMVRRRSRRDATAKRVEAKLTAEPPPAPDPEFQPEATEPMPGESLSLGQQIAMVCREAKIDRAGLIAAVTGKQRARDLTRPEAIDVLENAKAIQRQEMRLAQSEGTWILTQSGEPVSERSGPREPTHESPAMTSQAPPTGGQQSQEQETLL